MFPNVPQVLVALPEGQGPLLTKGGLILRGLPQNKPFLQVRWWYSGELSPVTWEGPGGTKITFYCVMGLEQLRLDTQILISVALPSN